MSIASLFRVRRDFTAAEVATLATHPIDIVPAQRGKVFWPISGVLLYRPGAAPYSGGGYLAVGSVGTVVVGLIASLDTAFEATEQALLPMYRAHDFPGVPLPLSQCLGRPLTAWAEVDPVGGDGVLGIGVLYRVLDVP